MIFWNFCLIRGRIGTKLKVWKGLILIGFSTGQWEVGSDKNLRRLNCGKLIHMMSQTVHSTEVIAVRLFVVGCGWMWLVVVESIEPWFFWIVYFSGSLSVPSKCFLVISSNTWTSKHINMIRDQTWIFMIIQKISRNSKKKCFQKRNSRSWPVVRRLTTVDPVVVLRTLRFVAKFNVRNVFVDLCGRIQKVLQPRFFLLNRG